MTAVAAVTLDALVLPPPLPALLSVLLVLGLIGLGSAAARLLPPGRRGLEERAAVTILVVALVAAFLHAAALLRVLAVPAVRAGGLGVALAGAVTAWRARGSVARSLSAARDAFRAATPGRRLLLALVALAAAAPVLVALGPVTDADSLDYHLGVPLDWLRHGGVTAPADWYSARLAGLGEMLGVLGLAAGTDGLGAAVSAASALLLAAVAARAGRQGGEPLAGAAMVLGCPVVLFLASTQKPSLLPSAGLVVALSLLTRGAPVDRLDLVLALGLVSFAAACKYTFLLAGAPLLVLAFLAARRAGLAIPALAAGTGWAGLLVVPVLARNAILSGDPVWPFLAALRDGPTSTAARYAAHLRTTGGSWSELAGAVVPLTPGTASTALGLGTVVALAAVVAAVRARDREGTRPERTMAAAACGAALLLAVLAPSSPRFLLEPFLFLAPVVAAETRGPRRRPALVLLGAQLAAAGAMGTFLAARLLPGAIVPSARERILSRDAAGRDVAAWLVSRGRGAGVLTDLRSRVFLPGLTGTDPVRHAPSSADAERELASLVARSGVTSFAFRVPGGLPDGSPCRAVPFVETRSFRLAVRNPFGVPVEELWGVAPVPRDAAARRAAIDCFYGR